MKRARPSSSDYIPTSYRHRTYLTVFPSDVLGLIVSYLDPVSFQSVCRIIMDATWWHRRRGDNDEYASVLSRMFKLNHTLQFNECRRILLDDIVSSSHTAYFQRGSEKMIAHVDSRLDDIRRSINNKHIEIEIFLREKCVICDKCKISLSCTSLWKHLKTHPSVNLCQACHNIFVHSQETAKDRQSILSSDRTDGGYTLVSASSLKLICRIPRTQRAEDYAKLHNVRPFSDRDAPFTTFNRKKEFYLLRDVLCFL